MTTGNDPAAVMLAGGMLCTIAGLVIVMFVSARWILSRRLGAFLTIFFVVYIGLSIVFEAEPQIAYEPIMKWLDYRCV
jgi:hypothetical protein